MGRWAIDPLDMPLLYVELIPRITFVDLLIFLATYTLQKFFPTKLLGTEVYGIENRKYNQISFLSHGGPWLERLPWICRF